MNNKNPLSIVVKSAIIIL